VQKDNSESDTVLGIKHRLGVQRGTPPGNGRGGVLLLAVDISFETGKKEKLVQRD
jgi:hypothetical protein